MRNLIGDAKGLRVISVKGIITLAEKNALAPKWELHHAVKDSKGNITHYAQSKENRAVVSKDGKVLLLVSHTLLVHFAENFRDRLHDAKTIINLCATFSDISLGEEGTQARVRLCGK